MMCGEIDLSYVGSLGLLGTVFVLLLDSVGGLIAALVVIGISLDLRYPEWLICQQMEIFFIFDNLEYDVHYDGAAAWLDQWPRGVD